MESTVVRVLLVTMLAAVSQQRRARPVNSISGDLDAGYDACDARRVALRRDYAWAICLNDGKCVSSNDKWSCECRHMYVGARCEYRTDGVDCVGHQCSQGSTCYTMTGPLGADGRERVAATGEKQAVVRKYQCWCPANVTGDYCERTPALRDCERYCNNRAVFNHSTFHVTWAGVCPAKCPCDSQFAGDRCEVVDWCESTRPCDNRGTCHRGDTRCTCIDIETDNAAAEQRTVAASIRLGGKTCEKVTASACGDPCATGVTADCVSHWGGLDAKQAPHDEHGDMAKEGAIACGTTAAQCTVELAKVCDGVSGQSSAADRLRCVSDSAMPGRWYTTVSCRCPDTHYGQWCEHERTDACALTADERRQLGRQSRCMNYGLCETLNSTSWHCTCRSGYSGELCQSKSPCDPSPCDSHSVCVPVPERLGTRFDDDFACVCPMGHQGARCDGRRLVGRRPGGGLIECTNAHCSNAGMCMPCDTFGGGDQSMVCQTQYDINRGYHCICAPNVAGANCESNWTRCVQSPCLNGALCRTVGEVDFECVCTPGFNGTYCEEVTDYCATYHGTVVCHQGKCAKDGAQMLAFRCDCDEGHEGVFCEAPTADWLAEHGWLVLALIVCPLIVSLYAARVYVQHSSYKQQAEYARIAAAARPDGGGARDDDERGDDNVAHV